MKQTKTPQKPAAQKPSAQPNSQPHFTTDSDERLAVAVDPDLKTAAVRRLRRIAGQVRGLESMVDQERYCADILVQIASVQEALRGVSRLLMRNHLEHCATMAIRSGGENANAMYDELLDLVYRHAR
jgi:CsoR family transcriptional regulator, copper-sensing transcriptional repressor